MFKCTDCNNIFEIPTGGTGEVQSKKAFNPFRSEEAGWIDPNGKFYKLADEGAATHRAWIDRNVEMLKKNYELNFVYYEDAGQDYIEEQDMFASGWVRVMSNNVYEVDDVRNVPQTVIDRITEVGSSGVDSRNTIMIGDRSTAVELKQEDLGDIQKAIQQYLRVGRAANKVASTLYGYWIAPSGEAYEVRGATAYSHDDWVWQNRKALIEQGIPADLFQPNQREYDYNAVGKYMLEQGWTRLGDFQGQYGAQVGNVRQIPSGLENFLPTIMHDGEKITVGDISGSAVYVEYPWKSLQNAVNKAFHNRQFVGKQARPRPKHRTDWTDTRFDLEPFSPLPTTFQKDINEKNLNWRHPWKYMGRPKGKAFTDQGDVTEILLQQEEPLSELEEKESKKLPMEQDDLIEEHKRIVKVLKSPSHKDDAEEAKKQEKELEEYKKASVITMESPNAPDYKSYQVFESPSASQVVNIYHKVLDAGHERLRYFIAPDNKLFVWDAWYDNHKPVIEQLGYDYAEIYKVFWTQGNVEIMGFIESVADAQKIVDTAFSEELVKASSVYTDKEMEEFYIEQHDYNDSDGGGNDYHDWMSNTNDFPKPEDLERPKVRLDRLDETVPVIPSYEVVWTFSLPKDEYHGDYPDEEYQKSNGI